MITASINHKAGDIFGKLLLTGKSYMNEDSHRIVECICICGKIIYKRYISLLKGIETLCGDERCTWMAKGLPFSGGDKYSYLTLTGEFKIHHYMLYAECVCVCGKTFFSQFNNILKGRHKSCGCKRVELIKNGTVTHGLSKSILYKAWRGMKTRCYLVNGPEYYNYGGRGITVCDEWRNDFMAFYNWAIENGWERGLSLDRFPNMNGNYEPTNCRWATNIEQCRNMRKNVLVEAFGEIKCVTEWSNMDICSIRPNAIMYRINKLGWDAEKAITSPPIAKRGKYKINN